MDIRDIPKQYLVSKNIYLTLPESAKAGELLNALNHFTPQHKEFLLWYNLFIHTVASTNQFIEARRDNFLKDKDEYCFFILDKITNCFQGVISIYIREKKIPYYEIGYWIAPHAMGKGIMTQACKMVTDIADKYLQAKRIELRTAARNSASRAVALKCHYQYEATLMNERLDAYDNIDDTIIYRYSR